MIETPTENTLTVNATHHMLADLEEEFTGPAALSPNRQMENILGYDTNLPLLKSVVFQYKRPYTVESDSDRRFSVNRDQWRTLTSLYEYNQAFFVFPEVVDATNLEHTLSRSVFIDVFGIRRNTSIVYVPENACTAGRPTSIRAKINNGGRYSVPDALVYDWETLKKSVNACEYGLRFTSQGEWTDAYSTFKRRVNRLVDGDIEWLSDRILSVVERQHTDEVRIPTEQPDIDQQSLNSYLYRLDEEGTDLSTHGIGRSRQTMLERSE
ncbi:hypothetical protein [Haloarcula sp. CGMCC 1.2071]|uniref:hypothetical protein n=1 Tax=Haloarcula sp. CGMCC 1.2071 TaxID=3111454 RepID=UPI00300EFF69